MTDVGACLPPGGWPAPTYDSLSSFRAADVITTYGSKDVILYALAVGVAQHDPLPDDLSYIYERDLVTLGSFATVLAWSDPSWLRQLGVDADQLVQLSERVDLHAPLPSQGTVTIRPRVSAVYDRGIGRGIVIEALSEVFDRRGAMLAQVRSELLSRAEGGLEGAPPLPQRAAPVIEGDLSLNGSLMLQTRPDQAALYRLLGDRNPIHIDPDEARRAGFPGPILHGLCTLGMAFQAITRSVGQKVNLVRAFSARFVAPVFPGDQLKVEYRDAGKLVHFSVSTGDGRQVLKNGLIEIG